MEHPRKVTLEGRVDVVLLEPGIHHKIVVERPAVHASAEGPFQSRPESGLALVGPWSDDAHVIPFILGSVHAAAALTAPVALIVGLRGRGEAAQSAVARARGVGAIVADDQESWVSCATEFGSLADVEAFLRYLNAMHGWGCFVEAIDGAEDDDAETAVLAFQQEYNQKMGGPILEDGVCGTQTLGAIFDVVRNEWTKWLEKHGLAEDDVRRIEWVVNEDEVTTTGRGHGGVDIWVLEKGAFEGGEVSAARVGASIGRGEVSNPSNDYNQADRRVELRARAEPATSKETGSEKSLDEMKPEEFDVEVRLNRETK